MAALHAPRGKELRVPAGQIEDQDAGGVRVRARSLGGVRMVAGWWFLMLIFATQMASRR